MLLGNKVMPEEMNRKEKCKLLIDFLAFQTHIHLRLENMFDSNHIPYKTETLFKLNNIEKLC